MGLLRTLLASVAKAPEPVEFLNCAVATLYVRRDEIGPPFVTRTRRIQRLSAVICDRRNGVPGSSCTAAIALGQKRTLGNVAPMSALPPKADIDRKRRGVWLRAQSRHAKRSLREVSSVPECARV